MNDRFAKFVAVTVGAHVALFLCGLIFLGLEFSVFMAFLWGVIWMLYCDAMAEKWDKEDGLYDENVSIMALALIGGPFCWLLCPPCLLPSVQRRASGYSTLWNIAQRVLQSIKEAVLRIMGILHSYCLKEFPPAE